MKLIEHQTYDEERALYGSDEITAIHCAFDGPNDGESAFKESRNVCARNCYFNLRYPFWHNTHLTIIDSEMTALCRAALWYCDNVEITQTKLHGIKAIRECSKIHLHECDIVSPEFGWFTNEMRMEHCRVESEYFMLRSHDLFFDHIKLHGKYSFQYIENAVFTHCMLNTKDALWHAKNVRVVDSTIRGEYLAWYCENVTFERCHLIGTQPLCYCKGLTLIDCTMENADLSFERSEVQATLNAPIISIKNPREGRIQVPSIGEIIMNDSLAKGIVEINE